MRSGWAARQYACVFETAKQQTWFGHPSETGDNSGQLEAHSSSVSQLSELRRTLQPLLDGCKRSVRLFQGNHVSGVRKNHQFCVLELLRHFLGESQGCDLIFRSAQNKGRHMHLLKGVQAIGAMERGELLPYETFPANSVRHVRQNGDKSGVYYMSRGKNTRQKRLCSASKDVCTAPGCLDHAAPKLFAAFAFRSTARGEQCDAPIICGRSLSKGTVQSGCSCQAKCHLSAPFGPIG